MTPDSVDKANDYLGDASTLNTKSGFPEYDRLVATAQAYALLSIAEGIHRLADALDGVDR